MSRSARACSASAIACAAPACSRLRRPAADRPPRRARRRRRPGVERATQRLLLVLRDPGERGRLVEVVLRRGRGQQHAQLGQPGAAEAGVGEGVDLALEGGDDRVGVRDLLRSAPVVAAAAAATLGDARPRPPRVGRDGGLGGEHLLVVRLGAAGRVDPGLLGLIAVASARRARRRPGGGARASAGAGIREQRGVAAHEQRSTARAVQRCARARASHAGASHGRAHPLGPRPPTGLADGFGPGRSPTAAEGA